MNYRNVHVWKSIWKIAHKFVFNGGDIKIKKEWKRFQKYFFSWASYIFQLLEVVQGPYICCKRGWGDELSVYISYWHCNRSSSKYINPCKCVLCRMKSVYRGWFGYDIWCLESVNLRFIWSWDIGEFVLDKKADDEPFA